MNPKELKATVDALKVVICFTYDRIDLPKDTQTDLLFCAKGLAKLIENECNKQMEGIAKNEPQ